MAKSSSCGSSSFWLQHQNWQKKKKKLSSAYWTLIPNSNHWQHSFCRRKGSTARSPQIRLRFSLPSLPPVTVGLRVAQRPLPDKVWGWLVLGSSYGQEGPTSLFLHVALCPRDPTKVSTFSWGRWRPGVSCSDTCVSLVSHKGQNLRDTYLLGEIPSRYLLSPHTYFGPYRLMRQPPQSPTLAGWMDE